MEGCEDVHQDLVLIYPSQLAPGGTIRGEIDHLHAVVQSDELQSVHARPPQVGRRGSSVSERKVKASVPPVCFDDVPLAKIAWKPK